MKSKNVKYWIWLSKALGFGSTKIKALYELYRDITVFCDGGEKEWQFSGLFTDTELRHLSNIKQDAADGIISRCDELGYSILPIDDDAYPKCLRAIPNPPAVLYVWGSLPDVDKSDTIGIVGTRTASNYGLKNSYSFGYALAKYKFIVVSGGALGVDCASHRGVLASNGVTVCVRGCGINYPYLMDNAAMREAITQKGAVISEYPPDTPPYPYQFPARNRIIAALSDGVLIIESGKKSGSLITANYALDMGKQLFALLGNNSPENEGSNERIKSGAAKPVTDFLDIVVALRKTPDEQQDEDDIPLDEVEKIPVKSKVRRIKPEKSVKKKDKGSSKQEVLSKKPVHKEITGFSQDAETVYKYLSDKPVSIDKISQDTGLPVNKIISSLTQLEIYDLIVSKGNRRFALK